MGMDITILYKSGALRLLLEIGDRPGQTVRSLISQKGNPSPTLKARLEDLEGAGLAEGIADTFRGKAVTRMRLTPLGTDVYRLLCVIRGMGE